MSSNRLYVAIPACVFDRACCSLPQHLSVNEAMALLLQEGAFRTSPDLQDHIGMWGAPIGIDGERFVRYSQWTFWSGDGAAE